MVTLGVIVDEISSNCNSNVVFAGEDSLYKKH